MAWLSVGYWINSLWPSDTIKWHRFRSTLVQVMACCLTAPSHYLSQCWLIFITEVFWHSPEGSFTWNAQDTYHWYEFEDYWIKIIAASPRNQRVKRHQHDQGNKPYFVIICWCFCFWYSVPWYSEDDLEFISQLVPSYMETVCLTCEITCSVSKSYQSLADVVVKKNC